MRKQLKEILLIDDNDSDNFLHEIVITDLNCAEKISAFSNGKEAIDYLNELNKQGASFPQFIFLDVNMPIMNGWDFLEAYNKFHIPENQTVIVLMLTTPLPQDQLDVANKIGNINEFLEKPLNVSSLSGLLNKYYPNHV